MKKSKKNKQIPILMYVIAAGLLFAGIVTLPFLGSYFFVSIAAIVAGCVTLVFIPTKSKSHSPVR